MLADNKSCPALYPPCGHHPGQPPDRGSHICQMMLSPSEAAHLRPPDIRIDRRRYPHSDTTLAGLCHRQRHECFLSAAVKQCARWLPHGLASPIPQYGAPLPPSVGLSAHTPYDHCHTRNDNTQSDPRGIPRRLSRRPNGCSDDALF